MIRIGEYNTLTAERFEPQGVYLCDDALNSVLLPSIYVPEGLNKGDNLDVFVYNDSEDRPVATTDEPFIQLNQFALLKVSSVTPFGAFMDWGLPKDLLVPFSEQQRKMEEGRSYLIRLYLDKESNRLVGSAKLTKFLNQNEISVEKGDEVELIIWGKTDLGVKVIINEIHLGLIYHNEIFQPLHLGDRLKGYIKELREDDRIDVSLQKLGYAKVEPNAQKVLDELTNQSGYLPLYDKSDPAEIEAALGMSKKTFKKAIGALYKKKLISLEEGGIRLNK